MKCDENYENLSKNLFFKFYDFINLNTTHMTHYLIYTIYSKKLNIFQVMDTAGQDEYSIMSSGYDGMDGYILVYDITNRKSFEVILNYL